MGNLDGKVAVITGTGSGIGRGIARALAKEGAIISTMGRRPDKIQEAADDFKQYSGKSLGYIGDVSKRSDVNAFIEKTAHEFGRIDILLTNAMSYCIKPFEETTDEELEMVIRSSLFGTIYCMQACFPYLKKEGGKVINFGSMAGTYGLKDHAAYAAGKEGILGVTRTVALEWGKYNIQVNAIAPLAASDSWEAFRTTQPPEVVKSFLELIPCGYMGDAERHVGRVCVFLASSDSDWITGRTLFVDGGQGAIR